LISVYRASDAAVFPSLYEPFGITALEAMAAKIPVVVTDTGGLTEIVQHEVTGIKVSVDNSDSLAWGILRVLRNSDIAERVRKNGYQKLLREYDWSKIAERTLGVYDLALNATPRTAVRRTKLQFFKFEEYPEEVRVLLLLHILGAADEENAKRPAELAELLKMGVAGVRSLLEKLLIQGYVARCRDDLRRLRYFLTKVGIVNVCAAFS
jgi:hypothetical protein